MKDLQHPKTKDEVRERIEERIESLSKYRDVIKDYSAIGDLSTSGKDNYLRSELDKLIEVAIRDSKYDTGCLLKCWIDDKMPTYDDVSSVLSDASYKYLKSENGDFSLFNSSIERFLLVYLPWIKIKSLIKTAERRDDKPLRKIVITNCWASFISAMRGIEMDLSIHNEAACSKKKFSAICRYILTKRSEAHGKNYISDDVSFDRLLETMSNYYHRKAPTYRDSNAVRYLEEMDKNEVDILDRYFI